MSNKYKTLLTIVVCTKGRPDDLDRLLKSLHKADDVEKVEILVVDNGNPKITSPVFKRFKNKFKKIKFFNKTTSKK